MFCFTSNENCHFSSEKRDTAKRVVDFLRERDTFRNTIMEIVEDFDEKSYNNNDKSWKSSRILRVNPNCFIFLPFFNFSFFPSFPFFSLFFLSFPPFLFLIFSFFSILHFSLKIFSFIFFHFLCLFSFFFSHVLSCSLMFPHVLSFSLSLLGAQNLFFFGASISLRFLLTVLM